MPSTYVAGLAAFAAILFWRAGDAQLASYVLFGFLGGVVVFTVVAFGLVALAARLGHTARGPWRFGLANLKRHALNTRRANRRAGSRHYGVIGFNVGARRFTRWLAQQIAAGCAESFYRRYSVQSRGGGATALFRSMDLMILCFIRWCADAWNRLTATRFAVRISLMCEPSGWLIANLIFPTQRSAARIMSSSPGVGGIARRRVAGIFRRGMDRQGTQYQVGDILTFNVAGTPVSARVSNIRKVDWDSFKVNFYVIATPGLLEAMPTSFVTSFYLATKQEKILNDLVRTFPNLSVIDVAAIMTRFRMMTEQVSKAVQFVFLFTVLAGLVVLYSAISTTLDERIFENAIMRTVGASRRHLVIAQLAEFSALGFAAGLLGGLGACGLGYGLSRYVLKVPFTLNPTIILLGIVAGTVGVSIAGMIGMRGILDRPPLEVIRALS